MVNLKKTEINIFLFLLFQRVVKASVAHFHHSEKCNVVTNKTYVTGLNNTDRHDVYPKQFIHSKNINQKRKYVKIVNFTILLKRNIFF